MHSLFKLSGVLLLSGFAFSAYAASQSITVNYTLTVPAACNLTGTAPSINKVLPVDGSAIDEKFSIKCNVPYTLEVKSANKTGQSASEVIHKNNASAKIPYNLEVTGGSLAVAVNGPATNVPPSISTTATDYTLSAKLPVALVSSNYMAGEYTDTVTINMTY
ncbi:spore coat protein U domain-containing protein [Acinetobacter sp. ANC 3813]|uniref:spore coat protein U domain-containing protein n=1 Tax=Acinetobacter sp. ANC 3813 TaxID=1977873 RepID=UPI000A358D55|nr:spore coat protein U domain-containing protein [Acinetobacter sp. ANC 3813]OTG91615.1 hypothetical protein B9T34_04750 [Acinetobacter sp. ANC 3813]